MGHNERGGDWELQEALFSISQHIWGQGQVCACFQNNTYFYAVSAHGFWGEDKIGKVGRANQI